MSKSSIWFSQRPAVFKTPWKDSVEFLPVKKPLSYFVVQGINKKRRPKLPPYIRKRVERLKRFQTIHEKIAREALHELGIPFARQQPICIDGKWYIMDFHLWRHKICLEIDGAQHYTKQGLQYDSLREQRMMKLGIKTVRLENAVMHNKMQAMYLIKKAIQ